MLAHEFGKFTSALTFERLPSEVVDAAKVRILDVIASGLVGYHLKGHECLLRLIAESGSATIWGEGAHTSLRDAVLVNSFLAHCAYLEDGSRFVGGHPSSTVIPGVLALAESTEASGRDVIAAVIAGYEVFLRIGRAIYPSSVKRGFQPTAILASIALAGACANLLRLDSASAKNALSIACNLSGGLKEATKSSALQPLQVAHSCHGGLVAALLAQGGGAGADAIFENGFLPAYSDNGNTGELLDGLGREFRIGETYMKVHGGCRGNHAPTDVVLALAKEHGIQANQVERVLVRVDSVTYAADIHEPTSGEQAQFSVAFSVAVALLDGNASIFQFNNDRLADPHVQRLMDRVTVSVDPRLDDGYPDKRGAAVDIVLKNGRTLSEHMENARGEPESAFSPADIEVKFIVLTEEILGQRAQQVRDMVMGLEGMANVKGLMNALHGRR